MRVAALWFFLESPLPQHVVPKKQGVAHRGVVTMEQPCMRAYSLLLIKTCHRRGIFAMGGMSAQIPVKNDPQANEAALHKVLPKLRSCILQSEPWFGLYLPLPCPQSPVTWKTRKAGGMPPGIT